jgi:UDP-glucuronate 4-epimerase
MTLVTGAAGFIGFHLTKRLLEAGQDVVGLDNLNDYYDVALKKDRVAQLVKNPSFQFEELDISERSSLSKFFDKHKPDQVVHLAAQAGVRYSLVNPYVYAQANVIGFLNLLEDCRRHGVVHLVYASSSSVYGSNKKLPFSVGDNVDYPVSLYAATKKSNELMAHVYSHLYALPTTGLRFFTVYGPWGRPDMAVFSFTKAILEGRPIQVFNYGDMRRDFTYIDDIIEGVIRVLERPPAASQDGAPYKLYNIGNHQPIDLMRFIQILEECLGRRTEKELLPMQPGDVPSTYADTDDLMRDVSFQPCTPIEVGLRKFVDWYCQYYNVVQHNSFGTEHTRESCSETSDKLHPGGRAK